MSRTAFAVVAHPDDIEFHMAGTLLLLGQAGFELHTMTVANGFMDYEKGEELYPEVFKDKE